MPVLNNSVHIYIDFLSADVRYMESVVQCFCITVADSVLLKLSHT